MERGAPPAPPPQERRGLGGATSRSRNTGRLLGVGRSPVSEVNWEALIYVYYFIGRERTALVLPYVPRPGL